MTDRGDQGTPRGPYLARPDQPYDEPYQARPDQHYQPQPVQPYRPQPAQPHQPPPDKLYKARPNQPYHEPPPDRPEKPRQSRRWWISGAAFIVLAVVATIAFILAPTGGGSGPDRYGQNAVDVVHELHICDNPQVDPGIATATCTLPDGIGYAIVATVDSKAERDYNASLANNHGQGCTMVVNGYLVTGPDRDTLTQALGNLEAFASKHHGYLVGDCS
jgi:hypothetical protein